MQEAGLSLYSTEFTNQDVVVTFTPASDVVSYSYVVIRDNKLGKEIRISNNQPSNITLDETGNYQIEITTFNGFVYNTIKSGIYKIDKEAPVIKLNKKEITYEIGSNNNLLEGVSATDNIDGDLTNKIMINNDELDFSKAHQQKLVYTVSDNVGNISQKEVILNVVNHKYISINIIAIIALLFIISFTLYIYNRMIKLDKRLSKYTVEPLKDTSLSILGSINVIYNHIIDKITQLVSKSEIANKNSLRYEKYIIAFGKKDDKPISFIGKKIFISIIFVLIFFLAQLFRFKPINIYEIVIPLLVGYFALDILYIYKYHNYRKQIENDLLQAITIMNNAFKSGRSISQAIDLVGNELDGAISDEFKKMSLELSFGLDVELVFKRFAKRIKSEEATYLTSSISILNKTGGNIIKVFTSIEKTLMNRKKLRYELKSLTGSSRLIMWVLTIVPIFFVGLITMINPEYFIPMFQNIFGFIIISVIIVLYVVYIIIVRKIMKIRM